MAIRCAFVGVEFIVAAETPVFVSFVLEVSAVIVVAAMFGDGVGGGVVCEIISCGAF